MDTGQTMRNVSEGPLGRLLIVDDEISVMTVLRRLLMKHGYEVVGSASGKEALEELRKQNFDLLLTDLTMPEIDGMTLLQKSLEIDPNLIPIMMTAHGTIETAVEAMRIGAFDYILKPIDMHILAAMISKAMKVRRLRLENVELRETVAIYELGKTISLTSDLETILNKVADTALQLCRADGVSVMLTTSQDKELYVAIARDGDHDHLLGKRIPMEKAIAGWSGGLRESPLSHNKATESNSTRLSSLDDTRFSMSMPMLSGGKSMGLINVKARERTCPFTPGETKVLSILASIVASVLENAHLFKKTKEAFDKLQRTLDETVYALALTTEKRDPYTAGHQQRVAQLSCAIAKEIGMPEDQIEGTRVAGVLHDIGKISVPAEILSKPGRITEIEFSIIKTHAQVGYDILKTIEFPWPVAQIMLQHHERMDGSGYPAGLTGKDILQEARILNVADPVEAMTSHRPYRPALGVEKALEEISNKKGVSYDMEVVGACLKLFQEKMFKFD
jgi:putative nucleotidyltransferase with HDIG domain